MRNVWVLGGLGALATLTGACTERAATYTLYRNSSAGPALRIHFATFDADESSPSYNMENCAMAMELLNANVAKLNNGEHPARFWCEKGRFTA